MSLSGWGYSFRQAVRSLTSSGLMSLASVATVAISLLVLAVVMLVAVNLELWAATVESQVEVKVWLKDGLSEAQKAALVNQVRAIPGVAEARYISKQQGLEIMKQRLGQNRDVLAGLEENNPLPDAIEVRLTAEEKVKDVALAIQPMPGVDRVQYGQGTVEKLLAFTRALRLAGFALVLLLLLATVLTISNTIRLAVYARRREIAIMKLVGATDWFIRRPFLMEGMLLGLLGAGLALALTGLGYRWVAQGIQRTIPFLPVRPPEEVFQSLALTLLGLGALLGCGGSVLSLRRFLKV